LNVVTHDVNWANHLPFEQGLNLRNFIRHHFLKISQNLVMTQLSTVFRFRIELTRYFLAYTIDLTGEHIDAAIVGELLELLESLNAVFMSFDVIFVLE
jgi:hypothetical protein